MVLSSAPTLRMPLASMSNVTLTCGHASHLSYRAKRMSKTPFSKSKAPMTKYQTAPVHADIALPKSKFRQHQANRPED